MIKMIVSSVAAVVLLGMVSAQAGDACGKAGKDDCAKALSQLNVTAEQQAKIDALKAECDQGGCKKTAHAKFVKGLEEILTAEQFDQYKAHCDKSAKGGSCPFAGKKTKS